MQHFPNSRSNYIVTIELMYSLPDGLVSMWSQTLIIMSSKLFLSSICSFKMFWRGIKLRLSSCSGYFHPDLFLRDNCETSDFQSFRNFFNTPSFCLFCASRWKDSFVAILIITGQKSEEIYCNTEGCCISKTYQ